MALTGQSYVCRASGPGGGGGASFAPDRTLFVAQAWPVGANPLVYFTAIDAAITQAIALTPGTNDPVIIVCYPGVYSEALTLRSNVFIYGHIPRSVTLDGAITWAPVHATDDERMALGSVRLSDNAFLEVTTTGKAAGDTEFEMRDVNVDCGIDYNARSGGGDTLRWWNARNGIGDFAFENVQLFLNAVQVRAPCVFDGDTEAHCGDCIFDGTISVELFANVTLRGSQANAAVSVTGGNLAMPGSKLTGVLTVGAGGSADLRMCEYVNPLNLGAGAGEVDRSIWQTTVGPTAVGDNVVPIAPPMGSVQYRVVLTQTAGPGGVVLVTTKVQGSFTLNDAAGGNTFDVVILRE